MGGWGWGGYHRPLRCYSYLRWPIFSNYFYGNSYFYAAVLQYTGTAVRITDSLRGTPGAWGVGGVMQCITKATKATWPYVIKLGPIFLCWYCSYALRIGDAATRYKNGCLRVLYFDKRQKRPGGWKEPLLPSRAPEGAIGAVLERLKVPIRDY